MGGVVSILSAGCVETRHTDTPQTHRQAVALHTPHTEQGRQQSRNPSSTHSYEGLEEDNVNERKYPHDEENPTTPDQLSISSVLSCREEDRQGSTLPDSTKASRNSETVQAELYLSPSYLYCVSPGSTISDDSVYPANMDSTVDTFLNSPDCLHKSLPKSSQVEKEGWQMVEETISFHSFTDFYLELEDQQKNSKSDVTINDKTDHASNDFQNIVKAIEPEILDDQEEPQNSNNSKSLTMGNESITSMLPIVIEVQPTSKISFNNRASVLRSKIIKQKISLPKGTDQIRNIVARQTRYSSLHPHNWQKY